MSEQTIRIGNIGNGEGELNADVFHAQLSLCDPQKELYLDFHSQGGEVMEGFSMFQAIKDFPGKTVARIKSAAFSIASYLAMACDEIQIAENGALMIHNPYGATEGDDEELANQSKLLKDMKENMVASYSQRTGIPSEKITTMMKANTFIFAKEAIESGFADKMIERVKAANIFTAYKLPQPVFASLCGVEVVGNEPSKPKEQPVAEEPKRVAATIKAIKTAFPKASNDFIVKCMEKEMCMEEVDKEMYEALAMENEELKAKIAAMEEEMPTAESEVVVAEEEEEEVPAPTAKRRGVAPVARASAGVHKESATVRWMAALDSFKAKGMNGQKAAIAANRANPGLREQMINESNS